MNSRSARSATLGMAVVAVAIGAAIPAVSATPVHIDADETFEGSGSTFTSTIEGCSSGTVSNGPFRIGGGPGTDFGKFNGFKAFEFSLRRELLGGDGPRILLGRSGEAPAEYRELVERYYKALAGGKP